MRIKGRNKNLFDSSHSLLSQHGATAIEAAMIFLLFFMLIFGLLDLTRLIATKSFLSYLAGSIAHYAAKQPFLSEDIRCCPTPPGLCNQAEQSQNLDNFNAALAQLQDEVTNIIDVFWQLPDFQFSVELPGYGVNFPYPQINAAQCDTVSGGMPAPLRAYRTDNSCQNISPLGLLQNFRDCPIIVQMNSRFSWFLPFLPDILLSSRAASYREMEARLRVGNLPGAIIPTTTTVAPPQITTTTISSPGGGQGGTTIPPKATTTTTIPDCVDYMTGCRDKQCCEDVLKLESGRCAFPRPECMCICSGQAG